MPITAVLSTSVCPSGLVGGMVIFSNGSAKDYRPQSSSASRQFSVFSKTPAASQNSPQSAAPHAASAICSRFVEHSAKLFDKGESRHQIRKAPPIIIFVAPQNLTSMPQFNVSRFVELHDLAVQRNAQSSSRDRDLNEIRVCFLVY